LFNGTPTSRFTARSFDHNGRETFASCLVAAAAEHALAQDACTTYDTFGRVSLVSRNCWWLHRRYCQWRNRFHSTTINEEAR